MKPIYVILLIAVAVVMILGTYQAFISTGEDFVTAANETGDFIMVVDAFPFVPAAVIIGLVVLCISIFYFALKR